MRKTVSTEHIASETALEIVTRCVAYASARDWEIAGAACDASGAPVAMLRTDNVVTPAIGFAVDKAFTAATLRRTTESFAERALSRPALQLGLTNRERVLVFPGGVPIIHNGSVVGGLGVSGAQDEEDVECAAAILAEMELAGAQKNA